jgi:hypothetical protein
VLDTAYLRERWSSEAGRSKRCFLGHKSIVMTLRYAPLAPENLHRRVVTRYGPQHTAAHEPATKVVLPRKVEVTA